MIASVQSWAHGARYWRHDQLLAAVLMACLGTYELGYLAVYVFAHDADAAPLFGDFFAFWSFAKFVSAMPAAQIYDSVTLQSFEAQLDGGFHQFYPFPYPPTFALLLWPLSFLGYVPAYLAWIAVTLSAYLLAISGPHWSWSRALATIAAPTTLLTFISGQSGFLMAALVIGGFRVLRQTPILGGALLGVVACKPQLFILIPIVLVGARQWRGLFAAAGAALAFAAASAAAFGTAMWLRWFEAIPSLWQLFEQNRAKLSYLMPTVASNLIAVGVGPGAAQMLQFAVAAGVALLLVPLFRDGVGRLNAAALQVGVFLTTPYAFIYDLPMMTSAVVTAFETRAGKAWRPGEQVILLLALVLPVLMTNRMVASAPIGAVTLLLLFGLIVRMCRESAPVLIPTGTELLGSNRQSP